MPKLLRGCLVRFISKIKGGKIRTYKNPIHKTSTILQFTKTCNFPNVGEKTASVNIRQTEAHTNAVIIIRKARVAFSLGFVISMGFGRSRKALDNKYTSGMPTTADAMEVITLSKLGRAKPVFTPL